LSYASYLSQRYLAIRVRFNIVGSKLAIRQSREFDP
jgi:hypothetical protein